MSLHQSIKIKAELLLAEWEPEIQLQFSLVAQFNKGSALRRKPIEQKFKTEIGREIKGYQ